jgi:hypothetical protein
MGTPNLGYILSNGTVWWCCMGILLLCWVKWRLTKITALTLGTLGDVLSLVAPNDWYIYCCFGEGRLLANWGQQWTQAARPQELVALT